MSDRVGADWPIWIKWVHTVKVLPFWTYRLTVCRPIRQEPPLIGRSSLISLWVSGHTRLILLQLTAAALAQYTLSALLVSMFEAALHVT